MFRCFQSIILLWAISTPVVSQGFSESRIKAEYILLLSGYVEWPDSIVPGGYEIGVFGSNMIYNELSFKSESGRFKGKSIDVRYFRRIKDITFVHILFVDKEENQNIRKVWNKIKDQPVLLITDSCQQYENIMINMLALSAGGKPFELNKRNIDDAGLQVSPTILYIGGREEELREIYKISEQQLLLVKKELETLDTELKFRYEELEQRRQEIDSLNLNIEHQKKELKSLSDNIGKQQQSLVEKTTQLLQQEKEFEKLKNEIHKIESQLKVQQDSIMAGKEILKLQRDSISYQQDEIKTQESRLGEQRIIISRQQYLLYFLLIIIVLISVIVFFVIRANQIRRRANRILKERNDSIARQHVEISKQKREILVQQEQLEKNNRAIEKQNQDIKASIYYALTIQNAILPTQEQIDKHFENFTIYLPKDIVSGDFYWYTTTRKSGTDDEMIFLAVVDCTGHGVPGGFLSMIGSRILSTIVNENRIYEPHKILERMDINLRQALKQDQTQNDDGMDVCLCRIDKNRDLKEEQDGKVRVLFSGARRPLYYSKNHSEVEMIRGDRKTVGGRYYKEKKFTTRELLLSRGDKIYLTTDGITDQPSPTREKFGIKRFMDILSRTGTLSIEEQKKYFEEELLGFMRYEKQRDDITVLGIKV